MAEQKDSLSAQTEDTDENTSPDDQIDSTASQDFINEIDRPISDNVRKVLNKYRNKYGASLTKISRGLDYSRPVVTKFLGDESKDKEGTGGLMLSRGKILNLFNELTKPPKEGKEPSDKQNKREELKDIGPDELLQAAGFRPERLKTVMTSSSLLEAQLTFISFFQGGTPINADKYNQIISSEDILVDKKNLLGNEEVDLLKKLDDTIWLSVDLKKDIKQQYIKSKKYIGRGITAKEDVLLFKSVLNNRITQIERFNLDFIVTGIERIILSIPWATDSNAKDIIIEIKRVGKEFENNFTNRDCDGTLFIRPITRTVVEYKHDLDSEQGNIIIYKFECVSTGTFIETATSAIMQNMGFKHCIDGTDVNITSANNEIKSLVSTVINVSDKSNHYASGEWASSDLVKSFVQALLIAGSKLFYQKFSEEIKSENYKKLIESTAKIKADFYELRYMADQFDIDNIVTDVNNGFESIRKRARENIDIIKKFPKDAQNTFLGTSLRITILSKLYELRELRERNNSILVKKINDSVKEICKYLKQVSEFNIELENESLFIVSAHISLLAEMIMYNLSFGVSCAGIKTDCLEMDVDLDIYSVITSNLFDKENLVDCFKEIDDKIIKLINQCKDSQGYDIHHSLGSYHAAIGRVLLYSQKENYLKEAFDRFLKACWHFQRIGLTVKVQRNIALAGRAKIRLNEKDLALQCIEIGTSIIDRSKIKVGSINKEMTQDNFISSINSRIELVDAEKTLVFDGKPDDAIIKCLKALKGSLILGLNRNTADILHTIYICARSLPNRPIKADMKTILENGEKFDSDRKIKSSNNFSLAFKVANKLNYQDFLFEKKWLSDTVCWGDITDELKNFLVEEVWNNWYEGDGDHPLSIAIKNDKFDILKLG